MSEQESPDDRPMIAYTGRTLPLESDECNLDGQADPAADPRGPRYTFGELLDQGGMGEVWQVFDSDLKRRVAMKLIHESLPGPAVRRRFVEEAQIAGQLDHPNIVPVYELGQTDSGRSYFTMKEVRGRSLADILDSLESGDEKTRTAFTLTRILQTMQKVCEAMSLAHARGIIHRDLKPSNIMLGAFGEVLVMDWGLALPLDVLDDDSGRQDILRRAEISDKIERIRRDAETTGQIFRAQDARLTMDGAILGTPEYMSPEQASGQREELSPATDVYAIGACLYELLTLTPPFSAGDLHQLLDQVLWQPVTPPRKQAHERRKLGHDLPYIPVPLEAILMKCLAKDRKERYRDAGALSSDIQRFLEGEPVSAYSDPLVRRLLRWGRKHPILSTTMITSLLLLVCFGSLWQMRSGRETTRRLNSLRRESDIMRQRNQALAEKEKTGRRLAAELKANRQRVARRSRAFGPYQGGLEYTRRRVRWDLALDQLNRAIQIDPEFAEAYLQRAETYLAMNQLDLSLADLGKVEHLAQTGVLARQLSRSFLHMGNVYRDVTRQMEVASKMYRKAMRVAPGSPFARIAEASLIGLRGRPTQLMAKLQAMGRELDHYWEVHLLRAGIYAVRTSSDGVRNSLWDQQKALDSLDRVIAMHPRYAVAFVHRSQVYRQAGQFAKALQEMDQAIALRSGSAMYHGIRASLRGILGRNSKALEDYDQAIKLEPNVSEHWRNRGVIKYRMSNLEGALDDLGQALQRLPNQPSRLAERASILSYRGTVRLTLRDLEGAMTDCAAALEAVPENWSALHLRALLGRQAKRYGESAGDFLAALWHAPERERPKIHYNRGQLWIDVMYYDKALNDFRTASKAGVAEGLIRRGEVYAGVGCLRHAERIADAGLGRKLSPKLVKTLSGYRDRWRKRASSWEARVRNSPDSLPVKAGQALAASFTRPVDEGLALFEKIVSALKQTPGDIVWGFDAGDLLGTYARLWNERGDSRQAIAWNRQSIALERGSDPVSQFQRGQRWYTIAGHYQRLASDVGGAAQGKLDGQAVGALRQCIAEGYTTAARLRADPALAQVAARPAFRRAFGK